MSVILKGRELDEYNKSVYSRQWLDSSAARMRTDYYKKDHYEDTLRTLQSSGGTKVLECGIGTGEFFALELARSGKDVYGIDLSDVLLDDCRLRFRDNGLSARLGIADVHGLPFKDGAFDATFAIGVMPYMKDLSRVVWEMVRVTRKGGMVVFDVMNPLHITQLSNYWYRVFEATPAGFRTIHMLKSLKRSLGFKTNFKEKPEKVNHQLISPPRMLNILRRMPVRYTVRGYNVLLPLNIPVIGNRCNLCERSRLFSHGLRDNRLLKYFGSKLVFVIEKP
ncbi:MAG: class I SAM-dependent methyltransferase [Candidatus Omnitrophica bacterium]|nr:class I SAM-dependent methyltransferase [Candidatus Omnitrophota bacterium]